jgi:ZIP family zinc transporter
MVIIFGIAAAAATALGGLFALRLHDRLHLVLGLSAGAVIGVAFFDLMPEALDLAGGAYGLRTIISIIALGFVCYLVLDRFIALHSHTENDSHVHHRRGIASAGALSLHSFLDGVGIGLAFQVSAAIGLVVALAVLVHDFSDGINTVNMILRGGGERRRALRWLALDASAPIIGVLSTLLFSVESTQLGLLLALFSGFFLYIGASDLLPESHHAHPVSWTTISTILGMGILFVITQIA